MEQSLTSSSCSGRQLDRVSMTWHWPHSLNSCTATAAFALWECSDHVGQHHYPCQCMQSPRHGRDHRDAHAVWQGCMPGLLQRPNLDAVEQGDGQVASDQLSHEPCLQAPSGVTAVGPAWTRAAVTGSMQVGPHPNSAAEWTWDGAESTHIIHMAVCGNGMWLSRVRPESVQHQRTRQSRHGNWVTSAPAAGQQLDTPLQSVQACWGDDRRPI